MKGLAEYIKSFYKDIPLEILENMIVQHGSKMVYSKKGDVFRGVVMWARIGDESLARIIDKKHYSVKDMQAMLAEDGDNLHFLFLICEDSKDLLRGLRFIVNRERPKTVSWFNPEMKFNIFKSEVVLCHQQQ